MTDAEKARLKELYLPLADKFTLVDVPDMRFAMIDGRGAVDRAPLDHAVKWLYAALQPAKRIAKDRMGRDFVETPVEGLWWADDMRDFAAGNREKMNWRMMVVTPDWLTPEIFDEGVTAARARLGDPPESLRVEAYAEGLCAQIMFIGPNAEEVPTIRRMHEEFLPANGLIANGWHHEIYLNDARRVAPDKRKTVLRQPVRRA